MKIVAATAVSAALLLATACAGQSASTSTSASASAAWVEKVESQLTECQNLVTKLSGDPMSVTIDISTVCGFTSAASSAPTPVKTAAEEATIAAGTIYVAAACEKVPNCTVPAPAGTTKAAISDLEAKLASLKSAVSQASS